MPSRSEKRKEKIGKKEKEIEKNVKTQGGLTGPAGCASQAHVGACQ